MSKRLETVGDVRLALEGIEDSKPIMSMMQPHKKEDRKKENSQMGHFVEVRVWEEGAIFYAEIYESEQDSEEGEGA